MDFDQLHTFLEIVRLKSFSKAAQTCYRTQPAISAQVRQLEQELRTALFERFGSRITLTTAGKIFSEYAEQMLELRRRAQNTINELDHNPRGELVIAANEATCIYVLPIVFAEYKSMFPAVQLLVDRSYGSRVVEAVMENIADFGMTQLPVQEKRLQVVNIHRDEIRLIVPARHPLAAWKGVIPKRELGRHVQLVLTDRSALTAGREFGVMAPSTWRLADLFAKHAFLLNGLGWGGMPRHVVEPDLEDGRLVELSIEDVPSGGLSLPMSAVYRASSPPGPAGRWMIERLKNVSGPAL